MFKRKYKNDLENIIKKLNELLDTKVEEKLTFEILDQKGKLETEKAKLLEEKIVLKDTLNIKEKLLEESEKEITSYKDTVKNLTSEINKLVKYKTENTSLKKENEKLLKELQKLKDEGMVLPKRVRRTGATKDTKQTLGIKESKVSVATKKELKKINELREKEAV